MKLRAAERKMLVQCLRHDLLQRDYRRILACDTDSWERVFHAAAQLGVAPLLYVRLNHPVLRSIVPTTVLKQHKGDFLWSQVQNMKRFAKLRDVLSVLHAKGIEVIILKGAALAELVYDQIGLRTMGDIDILVHEEDLGKVESVLEEMGFRANESYRPKEWYRANHHHLAPYISQDNLLTLEFHHDISLITSPIRVSIDDLWTQAQAVRIASVPSLTLSWEHMLLHLALHISDQNHFVRDVRGLCDVTAIVKRFSSSIDWDRLVRCAHMSGAETHLYFALSLSREALGAEVPSPVLRQVRQYIDMRPFEERLLRLLCGRAILIFEPGKHLAYDWVFLDLIRDLLNNRSYIQSACDITQKAGRRVMHRLHKELMGHSTSPTTRVRPYELPREHEILLRALLGQGQEVIDAWNEWQDGFDLSAIDPNGYALLPQLYRQLRQRHVPEISLSKLKGIYRHTWCKNQVIRTRMARACSLLYERGIDCLLLNGAALTTTLGLGLVPLHKFEFLVPANQFANATSLFRQEGWSQWSDDEEEGERLTQCLNFTHKDGTTCAIYRSLFAGWMPSWGDQDCWRHAVPAALHNISVRVISPTDHLLTLLVDVGLGYRHISPRWIADIGTLLNTSGIAIDWERLRAKAARLHVTIPVKRSLTVLQRLSCVTFPSEFWALADTLETTWAESYHDKIRLRHPIVSSRVIGAIAAHWCRYGRVVGPKGSIPGFIKYLQEMWQVPSAWLLPLAAIHKLKRQLVGRK